MTTSLPEADRVAVITLRRGPGEVEPEAIGESPLSRSAVEEACGQSVGERIDFVLSGSTCQTLVTGHAQHKPLPRKRPSPEWKNRSQPLTWIYRPTNRRLLAP